MIAVTETILCMFGIHIYRKQIDLPHSHATVMFNALFYTAVYIVCMTLQS